LRRGYSFRGKYWVPDDIRKWEYRRMLHQQLLPNFGSDIICLQEAEVNYFDEDFMFLEKYGYSAVKPVARDSKESETYGFTRPSLFFKTSKLTLTWHNPRSRVMIAEFKHNLTGKKFYVVNCHLQGGRGVEESNQKCFQLRSSFQQLIDHAKKSKIAEKDISCFVCGDFNSEKGGIVHEYISKGKLCNESLTKFFPKNNFHGKHDMCLQDSHSSLKETFYTFKWGVNEDSYFDTLDYIYFTPKLFEVKAIRNPLTNENKKNMIDKIGIPNVWHPSDHLPVGAIFKLR